MIALINVDFRCRRSRTDRVEFDPGCRGILPCREISFHDRFRLIHFLGSTPFMPIYRSPRYTCPIMRWRDRGGVVALLLRWQFLCPLTRRNEALIHSSHLRVRFAWPALEEEWRAPYLLFRFSTNFRTAVTPATMSGAVSFTNATSSRLVSGRSCRY